MTVIGKIRSRSLTREVPPWAGSGVGDSDGCAPVSWNGEVSLWRDGYLFPIYPRYGSMSEKAKWNRDHSPLCPQGDNGRFFYCSRFTRYQRSLL